MRRLKNRTILFFKSLRDQLEPFNGPVRFHHKDVPYFCQFESRDKVAELLTGTFKAEDDPLWQSSGARTKAEYVDWAWSGCGMACLKMILAYAQGKIVPLAKLGKQCLTYGGYKLPLKEHPGLYYEPFVRFIRQEYELEGTVSSTLTRRDIVNALGKGSYVIVSVNPAIRDPDTKPKFKGGHLILIIGYDLNKKELYFHNPSGISKSSQESVAITFKQFENFFGHMGIIIR